MNSNQNVRLHVEAERQWRGKRDALIGALMDEWRAAHAEARALLRLDCPELVERLDALYAHGDIGK